LPLVGDAGSGPRLGAAVRPWTQQAKRVPARAGHTKRHRRDEGASGMNTDLTDAEWALVADLFERRGGSGAADARTTRAP
jgi:putative transposase